MKEELTVSRVHVLSPQCICSSQLSWILDMAPAEVGTSGLSRAQRIFVTVACTQSRNLPHSANGYFGLQEQPDTPRIKEV